MNILFAAARVAPFSGWTPDAEHCAALACALSAAGDDVTVLSPIAPSRAAELPHLTQRLDTIDITMAGQAVSLRVLEGVLPGTKARIFFLQHPVFENAFSNETTGQPAAGMALGQAIAAVCTKFRLQPERFHLSGWQTLPGAKAITAQTSKPGCGVTFRPGSIGARPQFDVAALLECGWESEQVLPCCRDPQTVIDGAIFAGRHAGTLVVSSAAAARRLREIAGAACEGEVQAMDVAVLPPAIFETFWSPVHSRFIAARYSKDSLSGKQLCKADLQTRAGFECRVDIPLIAICHRGEPWSPERWIAELADEKVQILFWGSGAPEHATHALHAGCEVATWRTDGSPAQTHPVLAGCDGIVTADFENGTEDLVTKAGRFGAVAAAPASSPAGERIVDYDAPTGTGTGFVAPGDSLTDCAHAVRRMLSLLKTRHAFAQLGSRAMGSTRPGSSVAAAYRALCAGRSAT